MKLKESGIKIKPENKGKFTEYCGGKVTQECIDKGKNSSSEKIRKRATFAENSRKWKHQSGGILSKIINSQKPLNKDKYPYAFEPVNNQKTNIPHCAEYQNGILRNCGFKVYGPAWNLQGVKPIFSGYNPDLKPEEYDKKSVEKYNKNAADNLYKNFKSSSLDTTKLYITNMYYKGSPYQKEAFETGRDDLAGTHTGYLRWKNTTPKKKGLWEVTHNIHGDVHVQPFLSIQGSKNKWGATAIYEPKRKTSIDKIREVVAKWKYGGKI